MSKVDNRDDSPGAAASELADALARIAPPSARVAVRTISLTDVHRLTRSERALTIEMADVRRAEFASGRMLLRTLLDSSVSIMRAANGAPSLPPGVIGSLAHDRQFAVGAVTRQPDVLAMGVDFESITTTPLTPDEAAVVVRHDDVVPGPLAAFVMKEAVYKAWSGQGGAMLDHHDVRIEHDGDRFRATVLSESASAISTEFIGRLATTTRHWLALVVVTH